MSSLPPPTPATRRCPRPRRPHLEGELVDGADLVEVVEDEVEQGRPLRRRPVVLSRLVDLHFGDFGLLHLKPEGPE